MWYMYILVCADESYYVGVTNNIERRFLQHVQGTGAKYTRSHKPVSCVYSEPFHTRSTAQKREAEIKRWPRAKKEQLVARS
ncbi:MAG TPA: GIY-YIG nuclease family protein [Candidatus Paceibacterota bacterium]|nr:GIY-YIG nuclease family protein [Candidatus Paceibacterota bacterium]